MSGRSPGPVRDVSRGYGNAAVGPVAQSFVEAVMAIEADLRLAA